MDPYPSLVGLHSKVLRFVSDFSSTHFVVSGQVSRQRSLNLRSRTRGGLRDIDTAFALVRHITTASCDDFVERLAKELESFDHDSEHVAKDKRALAGPHRSCYTKTRKFEADGGKHGSMTKGGTQFAATIANFAGDGTSTSKTDDVAGDESPWLRRCCRDGAGVAVEAFDVLGITGMAPEVDESTTTPVASQSLSLQPRTQEEVLRSPVSYGGDCFDPLTAVFRQCRSAPTAKEEDVHGPNVKAVETRPRAPSSGKGPRLAMFSQRRGLHLTTLSVMKAGTQLAAAVADVAGDGTATSKTDEAPPSPRSYGGNYFDAPLVAVLAPTMEQPDDACVEAVAGHAAREIGLVDYVLCLANT